MNPALKYTLGRIGVFLVVFALLLPVPMDILLRLILAIFLSAAVSYFVLGRWRDELTSRMEGSLRRRQSQRNKLRAALAGEDATGPDQDDQADEKRH
ncbi:DUF4229 domain-containing protein [Rhizomonospora bruguierae]|uniref:DUF4229 domain-containing protein n=1 Tax=Rhizomonospora bruguierae TaxID=1581705 RepID=UPI001BCCEC74|nr:DUF4229 domain-containing protein [Micromonospora sp. NBRC 107566]